MLGTTCSASSQPTAGDKWANVRVPKRRKSNVVEGDRRGPGNEGYEEKAVCRDSRKLDLPMCFRRYGFPIPLTQNGPFWILRDGNKMLKEFGFCVVPVPRTKLWENGRYVVHEGHRCFNVHTQCGSKACLKLDGARSAFLDTGSLRTLAENEGLQVFCLMAIQDAAFISGGWWPSWLAACDARG